MEILLEVEGSRKVLSATHDEFVYVLENKLGILGIDGVLAYFFLSSRPNHWFQEIFYLTEVVGEMEILCGRNRCRPSL